MLEAYLYIHTYETMRACTYDMQSALVNVFKKDYSFASVICNKLFKYFISAREFESIFCLFEVKYPIYDLKEDMFKQKVI